MKIITTRVGVGSTPAVREELEFRDDVMVVACEGDTTLEVRQHRCLQRFCFSAL
jgi:hypothetical protein